MLLKLRCVFHFLYSGVFPNRKEVQPLKEVENGSDKRETKRKEDVPFEKSKDEEKYDETLKEDEKPFEKTEEDEKPFDEKLDTTIAPKVKKETKKIEDPLKSVKKKDRDP